MFVSYAIAKRIFVMVNDVRIFEMVNDIRLDS